jgi:hypothetical protein
MGPDRAPLLWRFLLLAVLAAIVEGVTVSLAVPVLTRLLSPQPTAPRASRRRRRHRHRR